MRYKATYLSMLWLLTAAAASFPQPQPPDISWTKSYTGNNVALMVEAPLLGVPAFDVKALQDGSFVMTAYCTHYRRERTGLWLCRVDSSGDTLWTRLIRFDDDLIRPQSNPGKRIVVTDSGDVAVIGETFLYDPPRVMFVLADTSGEIIITKNYDDSLRWWEAVDLCQTEGGFALLAEDKAWPMAVGGMHFRLIRINDEGEVLWTKSYGEDGKWYMPRSIISLEDGGFIICGYFVTDNHVSDKTFILRTDESGEVVWLHFYGYLDGGILSTPGLMQTGEDEFAAVAAFPTQNGPDGWWDAQITWLGGEGEILYTGNLIPIPPEVYPQCLIRTFDGGYALIGEKNYWMLRTDEWGSELYQHTYGDSICGGEGYAICATPDSGFVLGGKYVFWDDNLGRFRSGGALLMRLAPEVWPDAVRESVAAPQVFMLYPAFPNPFNASLAISYRLSAISPVSLKLFDVAGREVRTLDEGVRAAGGHRMVMDGAELAAGVYLLRMTTPGFNLVQKVVLIK